MKEYRIYNLKRTIIFCAIFVGVAIFLWIRWNHIYLNYQFNGRVDSIRYGEKGDAFIIIKRKEYILDGALSYSPNNKIFINKGDSMMKFKDSTQIKLIRSNGITIIQ